MMEIRALHDLMDLMDLIARCKKEGLSTSMYYDGTSFIFKRGALTVKGTSATDVLDLVNRLGTKTIIRLLKTKQAAFVSRNVELSTRFIKEELDERD